MQMMKMLDPFRTPSAEIIAQRELEQARRELLQAQAGQEYATAMVQYHQARIGRLQSMLQEARQ